MFHLYESTRNSSIKVSPSEAILNGLSEDGGLFVLRTIDELSIDLNEFCNLNFQETSIKILSMLSLIHI